jgi:hypothetical protein
MPLRPTVHRLIVAHARPEAFVKHTQSILARLGYQIMSVEDYDSIHQPGDEDARRPDLLIVDERRLGEVADEPGEAPIPIVLMTGRHGVSGADGRIVGAARRPVGLHDLYRLLQLVFEENPRSTPRVPTHISANCRRQDREWKASILSLSENGCLLRSPEPLSLGSEFEVSFELPGTGRIELHAETAYQFVPDLGLVFNAVEPAARDAIGAFVAGALIV